MVVLRREIAELCADRNDDVGEHNFSAEGVWLDLRDDAAVRSDVVGLCAAVLNGDAREWRTRRRRGLEVIPLVGVGLTATEGRLYGLPGWGWQRVRSRRRLPAYSLGYGNRPSSDQLLL